MAAIDPSTLPLHSFCNLINIKLNSSNYLSWRNQATPVFSYLNLEGHIKGTSIAPSATITTGDKTEPNPQYIAWKQDDQRAVLLLHSSLSEEAMAETIGHSSACQVWNALEAAYSHQSLERMHILRDSLSQNKKDNATVSEYGRNFKSICDQLAAIGYPVSEEDKRHWFLCGLGPTFENFSTAQRMVQPAPFFRDLLAHAENHEIFLKNLHGTPSPQAAFSAHSSRNHSNNKSLRGRSRGSSSSNRGRSMPNRRLPHCQLCRKDGHYAPACPDLASYAERVSSAPIDAHIA